MTTTFFRTLGSASRSRFFTNDGPAPTQIAGKPLAAFSSSAIVDPAAYCARLFVRLLTVRVALTNAVATLVRQKASVSVTSLPKSLNASPWRCREAGWVTIWVPSVGVALRVSIRPSIIDLLTSGPARIMPFCPSQRV